MRPKPSVWERPWRVPGCAFCTLWALRWTAPRCWPTAGSCSRSKPSCFFFLVAGTHGLIVPLATPTSTDFVSFYAAGALADSGTPELAYDQAAHDAAEHRATAAGIEYRFFFYPPVFLLLCAVLARLPYLMAFLVFEGATLALCLIVMREILAERGWSVVIPVLAFPATFWTLGLGRIRF